MNKEYKTFEELKEELGDKFEEFMYKSNIELLEKVNQLETNRDVLKEYIQDLIYDIEPKGTRINYNCEYDSEDDYIYAMKEQSRLETLKAVNLMIEILERGK